MQDKRKIFRIAGYAIAGAGLVLGVLWYYQQQGYIKIFPTAEDRRIKNILTIDRSKLVAPQGMTGEQLDSQIKKLEELQQKVLQNPASAAAWFDFANQKEQLNDHTGAVAAWEETLRLQPLNFIADLNLGNVNQYFLRDFPAAEFYYLKALEIQPNYTSAYQGLADLYRYNLKEKQHLFEPTMLQAVAKDSANQLTYYTNLVEFFASGGDIQKARTYLENVQALSAEQAEELKSAYPSLR
ncbi:MAG: hypothetical protein A2722_03130 [Candidatus Doudnabacteria bacterium RIFCSPHIGHO2_01_FULL_50_11]|uniref:Uncharacterized protein n=1 Tax=Candidatus Doudnabacteria bacterium RIFCSPHIGHO2_01_FULL_50_11 TaxID=1817828 RepID=A0A1F5PFR5_9BACT|nr:MAG: hypothetical protein A2722_03130 [Candidatus Doudnabacteria bacterium RIFCSPHIGHO2_01_FULL_50_11]HLC44659.1 hypothetical protein [Patescibacteria group bacterium]